MQSKSVLRALVPFAPAVLCASAGAQDVAATFVGSAPGERFGWSVAGVGDVDGDGAGDWIFGAPYADPAGTDSGAARVVSGATGSVLYQISGQAAHDHFGQSVAGAGDVNGDGRADFVVGAPGNDERAVSGGSAYVFSGLDGSLLRHIFGLNPYDELGVSVAGAGDVNGDGFDDVLAGIWGADTWNGTNVGKVRVVSGFDGSALMVLRGEGSFDLFGTSLAGLGDLDGDGRGDFAVGAKWNDHGGPDSGSTYVYSGADGSQLFVVRGTNSGHMSGSSVAAAGDVDGDGTPDVIVGEPGADPGGSNSGRARVFSGADGSLLYVLEGAAPGDNFGIAVAGAGDVDGDGRADLVAGGHGIDTGGVNAGGLRVHSGLDGSLLASLSGSNEADRLGFAVAGGGDVDGDGLHEILVGAYGASGGWMTGEALVFTSSDLEPCAAPTPFCPTNPNSTGVAAGMGWGGSTSVRANDLTLTCEQGVPGQPALFFYGDQQIEVPFGDGFRCAGGNVQRLGVETLDIFGGASLALDLTDPPQPSGQISAGSTWFFQVWYRDPAGASGFNLSDALSATFCP